MKLAVSRISFWKVTKQSCSKKIKDSNRSFSMCVVQRQEIQTTYIEKSNNRPETSFYYTYLHYTNSFYKLVQSVFLYVHLVFSIAHSIFLYACETWTMTADLERRIHALEMRCYGRLLGISYKDHISSKEVAHRIEKASGHCERLLPTVKRRRLKWFGHVTRGEGLVKRVLQGTVKGGRKRGRQNKRWEGNVTEWTRLKFPEAVRHAENTEE